MGTDIQRPAQITMVSAPACHFCEDAESALGVLSGEFAIDVDRLSVDSAEGQRLIALHRATMAPLIVVNGEFFSSGRLRPKKLAEHLRNHTSAARSCRRPQPAGAHRGQ